MKNPNFNFLLAAVVLLTLLVSCIEAPKTQEVHELKFLVDGNIKNLVGFEFGDEFDYNLFEIAGYRGTSTMYCMKDLEAPSIKFLFDGTGNRFSGVCAFSGNNFFGIKPSEDTLKEVMDILGEPDEYKSVEKDETGHAVYYYDNAALHIRINEKGKISVIEYIASEDLFTDIYPSDTPTEYDKDLKNNRGYAETIYVKYFDELKEAHYHPYNEQYDENQKTAFIKDYLQEQGINKDVPDGTSYDEEGNLLVEYYTTKNNQFCFIVHIWGNYWIDYEARISTYTDAIYCATFQINELTKAGNIIYDIDSKQGITSERLYDAQGKRMASVSYEYVSGIPFPFITDSWNITAGYELTNTALCREQKTWFYKDQAQFDNTGKFISYKGNADQKDRKEYLSHPCISIYDTDGKLKAIQEDLLEYDTEMEWGWWDESVNYSGQIEFSYHKNGNLSMVDYLRSSYTHGTTDSSGRIYCDEKGRMIMNSYYVTSGREVNIFLYEEHAKRPWACFYWNSFGNGFEKIYLFQPD